MTDDERATLAPDAEHLERLLDEEPLILAGPALGPYDAGIAVFEAPDEAAARRIMDDDPAIAVRHVRGEPRPFRVSLLRGRE